jgi:hypothetical protein
VLTIKLQLEVSDLNFVGMFGCAIKMVPIPLCELFHGEVVSLYKVNSRNSCDVNLGTLTTIRYKME